MTAMDVMNGINGIPHLLWTTSWQAGVMAGAIWLACRQWPRMPVNLRVMLWWLVSLKFVMGLVWTQPILLPVLPAAATVTRSIGDNPFRDQSKPLSVEEGFPPQRANPARRGPRFGEWVISLWLLGVIAQGVLLIRQLVRTRRLIARSLPVEGDAAELFDDLVTRLDIRVSQPELRMSIAIATPQVIGLTRPVILLPVGALESFSTRELSLTLCHELMHVKRFDLWHGWIPSVAARLFFFHPLARLAAREYAIAREAACDARVLAFMDAAAYDYGRLLMRLGITAREAAPAAAGASPTLHTLKRRLLMLHDASPHTRRLSPRWWPIAAIAALLVIPMRPTATQNDENPKNPANQQNQENRQNQQNPRAFSHDDDDAEPWVFVQDDDNAALHGNFLHLAAAKRLRANASEPLIWFQRGGRAYVIRDPDTIDKARALFMPKEGSDKAMRALEDRQLILRAQQDDLGQQQEALRVQMRDFDRHVEEAAAEVRKTIAPPPHPSDEARLRVVEEIRLRESRLREAEARRGDNRMNQELLGMKQRALGEQQAALAAEQEALARHQKRSHGEMEGEMRALFERAFAAGLATPVK
jgi:bla regulator protein BlaR1